MRIIQESEHNLKNLVKMSGISKEHFPGASFPEKKQP